MGRAQLAFRIIDSDFAAGRQPWGGVRKKGDLLVTWSASQWQAGWGVRHIGEHWVPRPFRFQAAHSWPRWRIWKGRG